MVAVQDVETLSIFHPHLSPISNENSSSKVGCLGAHVSLLLSQGLYGQGRLSRDSNRASGHDLKG